MIINTFGNDQPGIVSKISGEITSLNGNIIKSNMMKIDNIFSVIMIVNIPIKNKNSLMKKINQMPRLHSLIENIDANIDDNKNYKKYSFALECLDNEGIVHHFTKYLNDKEINIETMNTSTNNAPVTGITLFTLDSIICIPIDIDIKEIKKKLNQLCEQFNVNYSLLLFKSK